ncbi:MAG: response regulator [Bacteroidales bacterium]|nr:response regulator [Bacteroidales bacterium]
MDIRLPEIDGYELTRLIKSENPDIKIIAHSAYVSEEDQERAFEAGCDDFIGKPVDKELFFCKLIAYLNS